MDNIPICLIGGTGRSGTTILKKIFSKHPDVADIPEWRFTIDPDGLIDFYSTFFSGWSPFLFDVKRKRLRRLLLDLGRNSSMANFFRLGFKTLKMQDVLPFKLVPQYCQIEIQKICPDYKRRVDRLMEDLTDFRFNGHWMGNALFEKTTIAHAPHWEKERLARLLGDFFRNVIRSTLEAQRKSVYVEDNTWNILWFDKMLELVPEAKLVHIYRDPRDVVASYMKQTWTPTDPVQGAKFIGSILDRWWQIRDGLPTDAYLEISLESMVSDPTSILQDVCMFWGIDWHESLLKTDLSRSHSGRWKKDLNNDQKERVQSLLAGYIEKLGYST